MKKTVLALLMVMSLFCGSTWAYQVTIDRLPGYFAGSGGEFTVTPAFPATAPWPGILALYSPQTSSQKPPSLQTFCIEMSEGISIPGTYDVQISDRASWGGVGPAGDPLSQGAAWLYHEFQSLRGLQGYDYTVGAGRAASAEALQATFWWLEDATADPGATNPLRELILSRFGTLANAQVDNNGLYDVAVLNITTLQGVRQQDMLVCYHQVPEPGTLMFLGAGLAGLGFAIRRRKK